MRAIKVIVLLLTGAGLASLVWFLIHSIRMETTLNHELYRSIRVSGQDAQDRTMVDMKDNHTIAFGVSRNPGAHITLKKDEKDFIVDVLLHQDTVLTNVSVWREHGTSSDGKMFQDIRGQRWELVSRDLSKSEFYRKHPDLLLKQHVWFGTVRTDGREICLHVGEAPGKIIKEVWKLAKQ